VPYFWYPLAVLQAVLDSNKQSECHVLAQEYFVSQDRSFDRAVCERLRTDCADPMRSSFGRVITQTLLDTGGPVVGDDTLFFVSHSQLSRSGKNFSVVSGRTLTEESSSVLLAYPQLEDLDVCSSAARLTGRRGGPGFMYPGCLGALKFELYQNQGLNICVEYLQSAYHPARAAERGVISKALIRAYSGWSVHLLRQLFEIADRLSVAEVSIPNNRLIAGLGSDRFDKLAGEYDYQVVSQEHHSQIQLIRKDSN
jgi:hypothetical protein